ncbi:unnamed protein product [Allacma fusca]|uniref:Tubulin/FtsZ GTPase domain-containing protein n=1 Tax=Allacma fusca TaxID=39272 RepID=A0A8J2LUM4_9HEXA|nr:unnamed protein product [Allacma fusca]
MSEHPESGSAQFKKPTSKFKRPDKEGNKPQSKKNQSKAPICDTREVLTICVGHAGCTLGSKLNEVICDEHGIDPNGTFMGESDLQLYKIDVFYQEAMGGNYVPRTVLIDLDAGDLDNVRGSMYGRTFRPSNFVFSRNGSGNNFAKSYYTSGADIIEESLDAIRREAESATCLQGFQILHSIGGGTGSGLGSLLLDRLRDEYSGRIISTWSIMPSPKISDEVLEPYNAILANKHMIDKADFNICVDNEALYDICNYKLRFPNPTFSDLNHLISVAMSGVTAAFRFPGTTSHTLRSIATTLVPYPKLHYLIPGYAPLTSRDEQPYSNVSIKSLLPELLSTNSMLSPCDPKKGSYLATAILFRGGVSAEDVLQYLDYSHVKSKDHKEWLPTDIQLGFCDIPARGLKLSATALVNSTAITCTLKRLHKAFQALYSRKAFQKWYLAEGMEESEFSEANAATEDLISEYQSHEGNSDKASKPANAKGKNK